MTGEKVESLTHPTLDDRPVLIGDELVATVQWDEGDGDVNFQVRSIFADSDDTYFVGTDGEEYRLRDERVRRA